MAKQTRELCAYSTQERGGDERLCCGHGEARDKLNGDMASVRASKTAVG